MTNDRRKFLKLSAAALASGLTFQLYSCGNSTTQKVEKASASLLKSPDLTFGIQLYSLKEDMAEDHKSTLQQLAQFGYKQIESFEGKTGMFWGMPHTEFKQFTSDLGLDIVASHCNIHENFEAKVEQAAEIGMKYLICPWIGPQGNLDAYKKITDKFNQSGEICKEHGIRFAYHNHDYSFKEIDGVLPQDLLIEQTDPKLVDFELDIYWITNAGLDPGPYFEKHKNRIRLCHIKDRTKEEINGKFISTKLGTGSIDYVNVLQQAQQNGMQYFMVEQEQFHETTPIEAAKANAVYMHEVVMPALISV